MNELYDILNHRRGNPAGLVDATLIRLAVFKLISGFGNRAARIGSLLGIDRQHDGVRPDWRSERAERWPAA
jgi:hypothetical protein